MAADQLRKDPALPHQATDSPVMILDLDTAAQAASADLIILMIDSRKTDTIQEQELVKAWHNAAKKVLVFINQMEAASTIPAHEAQAKIQAGASEARLPQPAPSSETATDSALAVPAPQPLATRLDAARLKRGVVWGSALDHKFLTGRFAQATIELIPDHLLGLGRFFPLFRAPIAHYMINDTCFTNAAYSFSTGLAEIIPNVDLSCAVIQPPLLPFPIPATAGDQRRRSQSRQHCRDTLHVHSSFVWATPAEPDSLIGSHPESQARAVRIRAAVTMPLGQCRSVAAHIRFASTRRGPLP